MNPTRLYPDARPTNRRHYRARTATDARSEPFLAVALRELGVPQSLTARLCVFVESRHPGDQERIYHGLAHTYEVTALTARVLKAQASVPADRKVLLTLAAALHDVDPARAPNTPARVAGTLAHLDSDPEARRLLFDFGARFRFTRAQVKALILATDFSAEPGELQAKQAAFESAAAAAFPGEPQAVEWGRLLAYLDQIATYLDTGERARRRVEGLALEIQAGARRGGRGDGPTLERMMSESVSFLAALRKNNFFAMISENERARFDAVAADFNPVSVAHPVRSYGGIMKTSKVLCLALLAAVAAAFPSRASASERGDIGLGVILGEPIGGSGKLWLDDRLAIDFGAGLSDGNAGFWGDLLWHDWTLLPQPADGRLAAYLGAGPQIRTGDAARFGIRTVIGATYRPSSRPLELFAEAGPMFRLTQGGQVDGVGGVGLRVYVGKAALR